MDSMATYSDILSLSSHKMYGPKGIGVVRVSRELRNKIEPLIYGGGQQNGLRSGTVPTPLCIGMAAAADLLAGDAAEDRRADLRRRRDAFIERLRGLAWPVAVNGPEGRARHPGNANIRFPGFCAHDILSALQPRLAASTGSACTSGIPEPSHVLRAIGLDGADAESSIRFSLGFGTCDADVERGRWPHSRDAGKTVKGRCRRRELRSGAGLESLTGHDLCCGLWRGAPSRRRWCADAGRPTRFTPSSPSPTDAV